MPELQYKLNVQSATQDPGNHGAPVQHHAVMTDQEHERDPAKALVTMKNQKKEMKKLPSVSQGTYSKFSCAFVLEF